MDRTSLNVTCGARKFSASIFKLGVCWYCHTCYQGRNFVIRASDDQWRGWKDPQRKMIQMLCAQMRCGKPSNVVERVERKMKAAA
jgi:hypothetical protein